MPDRRGAWHRWRLASRRAELLGTTVGGTVRTMPAATSPLSDFDGKVIDGLLFCSKVDALYESIRGLPDGVSRMRLRPTRVERRLLTELLPICAYVLANYQPGRFISVMWMDGNQQCDAELFQRGAYVSESFYPAHMSLEVTCAMHPKEHLMRKLLDTKGGAFGVEGITQLKNGTIQSLPVSYTNYDFVDSYAALLRKQIAAKGKWPFPKNTVLVVQCTLTMPYSPDEWTHLVDAVRPSITPSTFREIFLYETWGRRSVSLYPR